MNQGSSHFVVSVKRFNHRYLVAVGVVVRAVVVFVVRSFWVSPLVELQLSILRASVTVQKHRKFNGA